MSEEAVDDRRVGGLERSAAARPGPRPRAALPLGRRRGLRVGRGCPHLVPVQHRTRQFVRGAQRPGATPGSNDPLGRRRRSLCATLRAALRARCLAWRRSEVGGSRGSSALRAFDDTRITAVAAEKPRTQLPFVASRAHGEPRPVTPGERQERDPTRPITRGDRGPGLTGVRGLVRAAGRPSSRKANSSPSCLARRSCLAHSAPWTHLDAGRQPYCASECRRVPRRAVSSSEINLEVSPSSGPPSSVGRLPAALSRNARFFFDGRARLERDREVED